MVAHRYLLPTMILLALSACGRGDAGGEKPLDPAISAALAGPLLTEPDLAAMNGAGRALSGTGVASATIPANLVTPESIDAARAEAKALVGGTIQPAAAPASSQKAAGGETVLHSLRRAFGRSDCENGVAWSAAWAARLPQWAAIYPRGHVEEALGSDAPGCALRAVTFRTGVPAGEVIDFYWTQMGRAGLRPEHRADGDAHAIEGRKGGASLVVFVRPGPDGLTEVHLLTKAG